MTILSDKKSKRMQVDFTNPYPPPPREVFFDLNNVCNSRCFFCSNKKIKNPAFLEKGLGFRLMKDFFDFGVRDIGLFATGEPFMRNDFVDFVKEAKRIGYSYVFINTNGILATPERAQGVLEAGLDSVKFSINAPTKELYKEVHGVDAFDQVIENIKWFHRYRQEHKLHYKLYASMVMNSKVRNKAIWEHFHVMLSRYLDDLSWRECSNQGGNILENNSTEEINKDNLLGSLKKDQFTGKCPDPFFRCTVTPQGYLSACVVDYQNYLIIADLNTIPIKEAWHSQVFVDFRKRHINNDLKGLMCYQCLNNCEDHVEPLNRKFAVLFKDSRKK